MRVESTLNKEEIEYMDRAVEAWAQWSYGSERLNAKCAAAVLGIKTEDRKSEVLALTDDQLTDVDRQIAKLPPFRRRLLRVHYCSSEDEPMERRYRRVGLDDTRYKATLRRTLQDLYNALMPEIERWRLEVL